jgi:hypothetical protein
MRIDRWMAVRVSVLALACESAPGEGRDGGGIDAAFPAWWDAGLPAFPDAHFDRPDAYVKDGDAEGAEYFVRFDADRRALGSDDGRTMELRGGTFHVARRTSR